MIAIQVFKIAMNSGLCKEHLSFFFFTKMKWGLFHIFKNVLRIIFINVNSFTLLKMRKPLLSGMGNERAESTVIGLERV